MEPKEINVAIAEYLGVQTVYFKAKYDNHGRDDYYIASTMEEAEEWPFNELGIEPFVYHAKIPNYSGDLNAIHKAIASLSPEKLHNDPLGLSLQDLFVMNLEAVIKRESPLERYRNYFREVNATALQHAEAFLRTVDEWEE